jgi:hypothetical protein
MRLVPLSDHPGDMLAEARRRRETAAGPARGNPLAALWRAIAAWWRGRGRTDGSAQSRSAQSRSARAAASRDEGAYQAGIKGEQEVATVLGGALGDAWALVKGYYNRRGEIDYLLLGPGGLFAVEVKYVNGTFDITRERWRYVRYDNYGNRVADGLVADVRRRPPNVQLLEPLARNSSSIASGSRS